MCQVPECTGRRQMSPGAAAAELWAQPKALDRAGAPGREKLPSASPGSLCLCPGQHTHTDSSPPADGHTWIAHSRLEEGSTRTWISCAQFKAHLTIST